MPWTEKLPSGRYRGMYRLPNGQKRSAGTYPHKKRAKDAAIEAEAKVKKPGWRDPRDGLTTWSDWRDIWWPTRAIEPQTRASEASMVANHIMPRWGDVALADIKRQDVQAWMTGFINENIGSDEDPRYRAPSTARRILNVFVSSMSAAVDAELIAANPALRIKLPPMPEGSEVFLTRAQYAALVDAVPKRADRAVLDFLVGTGARWGEMAGLHLHNLDLEHGRVRLQDVTDGTEIKPYTKGRHLRYVPLMQWVVDNLDLHDANGCGLKHRGRKGCPSGLVFPGPRGGVRDDRNFSQRVLAPAITTAGLEQLGMSLHDLRHTYASWLIQDGVPLTRVCELLGHASIQMTERYAHLEPVTTSDIEHAIRNPHGANMGQIATTPGFAGLRLVTPESTSR